MIKFIFIFIFTIATFITPHEQNSSRADFFKEELRANDALLIAIETIDNEFRIKYQRLSSEIQYRNTELDELVKKKPFNERKAKAILKKLSEANAQMKLYNIQHHLAIEGKLDSYQRMKFNEYFKPY